MRIYYVARREHLYTIRTYLDTVGAALSGTLVPLPYERLFRAMTREFWWTKARESYRVFRGSRPLVTSEAFSAAGLLAVRLARFARPGRRLPLGTYIFSDLERLSPDEAERAALVWHALSRSGAGGRLLNHPTRSMRRYELLRTLYERGINTFNVYRLTEARRPDRYPVFLRRESAHIGAISPLLRTPSELEDAIARVRQAGTSGDDVLITEFCDTADEHGIYRRYGAFIVGARIFTRSVVFSKHWMQKGPEARLSDEHFLREEREQLERNPHADALREIFALARVEYGRMDYGVLDGKIQTWEINTNPTILGQRGLRDPDRRAPLEHLVRNMRPAFEEIAR